MIFFYTQLFLYYFQRWCDLSSELHWRLIEAEWWMEVKMRRRRRRSAHKKHENGSPKLSRCIWIRWTHRIIHPMVSSVCYPPHCKHMVVNLSFVFMTLSNCCCCFIECALFSSLLFRILSEWKVKEKCSVRPETWRKVFRLIVIFASHHFVLLIFWTAEINKFVDRFIKMT